MNLGPSPLATLDPLANSTPATTQTIQIIMADSANKTIIVTEKRSRFWSRIGWIGFLVCLALLIAQSDARKSYFDRTGGIQERFFSGETNANNKIAVIHVSGAILTGSGFVKQQIDRIRQDENIKGVILRINSPGGTISGSHYLYHHLSELRKARNLPMVVSMGGVAASGGYYIAMAVGPGENLIYAEPTTTTGSIGVIIPNYNITGLLDKFGVKDESIKSHPLKDMLSMTRPMTDEEELILQDYVDESFRRFKRVILATRPQLKGTAADSLQDPQTEKDLATGQIFTADQAMQSQLIDQIGFVEDAVARIRELAGLTDRNSKVVEYRRPFSLSGMLGVASAPDRIEHDARPQAEFWTATAPQAYYLSTTIPPLMSSLPLAK